MTLEKVKAGRRDEAERAAAALGAEIEFFDAGDYPLHLNEAHMERLIDIYRELNPSFVLTHSLEDPYNVDHPAAAAYRPGSPHRGAGDGPQAAGRLFLQRAAGVPVRAAPAGNVQFQAAGDPQHRRGLGHQAQDVRILAAQKHLWAYYERVALQRGMQGGRNSGKAMTYGEAYQRLFPMAMEELV